MRQRNIKNLGEKLAANSAFLIEEPRSCKGRWAEVFGNDNPIMLEIGCGKGKFITGRAAAKPHVNYIGVEGQSSVVLRALEKAQEGQLANLRIFIDFVHDLRDYFEAGELSGLYLNFSDPWPKAKHAKRRLTYRKNLENYRQVLKPDASIEFKTDNEGLFEFSIGEIAAAGYDIAEMTRDLHSPESEAACESARYTTEYEDRFAAAGKNIYYVKFGQKRPPL